MRFPLEWRLDSLLRVRWSGRGGICSESMAKISEVLAFLTRATVTGLALAFLVVYFWPSLAERLRAPEPEPAAAGPAAPNSYADAVNRAAPAVVSIYTRSLAPTTLRESQRIPGVRLLYRLHADEGSGVLLSEDGYILTNHHVISGVQNIAIALWDGRVAKARVVGSDPETDLAVLKVDLSGLPVAPVAADPELRVGDVVLAIGNALGLRHTVTMGIVSATGRNDLRSLPYEDFIQTDAAINRGNSGGALINARGELVGINTRVLEPELGSQNIGFAIPISLARNVMRQIIDYGSVRRGWLGATFSDIRPSLLPDGSAARQGVVVSEVTQEGPAWIAGIRPNDVIVGLDGEAVADANQLALAISQREPGSRVEIEVSRRQGSFQTYATLIQQPPLE
jgi:serine peptidase DegS